MKVEHLSLDEFEVEWLVRKLEGSNLKKFNALKAAFETESKNPVLKPFKAHEAARKNPLRDIQKCINKLV